MQEESTYTFGAIIASRDGGSRMGYKLLVVEGMFVQLTSASCRFVSGCAVEGGLGTSRLRANLGDVLSRQDRPDMGEKDMHTLTRMSNVESESFVFLTQHFEGE